MVDVNSVVLDNNTEYIVLATTVIGDNVYYLLSNINDDKDIKIGKYVIEDNEKYFVGISDEEEFKNVLVSFNSKLNN